MDLINKHAFIRAQQELFWLFTLYQILISSHFTEFSDVFLSMDALCGEKVDYPPPPPCKSFMKIRKRIGPKTDPWGTPDKTGTGSET